MALDHVIPDDGWPHSPTGGCGCGPQVRRWGSVNVLRHLEMGPVQPCKSCASNQGHGTRGYHKVPSRDVPVRDG